MPLTFNQLHKGFIMQRDSGSLFVFVHIEKCGGTTVIDALRRTYLLNHVDVIPKDRNSMLYNDNDFRNLRRLRPRVVSVSGHSIRIQSNLDAVVSNITYFTCLRDPVSRYLSEYYTYVERLGMGSSFKDWLDRTDRHNFQTRAIAGKPDLKVAKQILSEKFVVVGVLEDFEEFFARLSYAARVATGRAILPVRGLLNPRNSGNRSLLPSPQDLLDQFGDSIKSVLALDIELYRYARETIIPRQRKKLPSNLCLASSVGDASKASWSSRLKAGASLALCRTYRNLIYKPYMGRWPVVHRLPAYEGGQVTKFLHPVSSNLTLNGLHK